MELRVLKYFIVVATELNITKAASLLHITQPTLSRQIHDLEDELQVQLFYRKNNSIMLTPKGRQLLEKAIDVVNLSENIPLVMKESESLEGILNIGMVACKASDYYLPIWLKKFHQRYPNVVVSLFSNSAEQLFDSMDKGILDCGIILNSGEHYDSIDLPLQERWGILVPNNHKFACKEEIDINELVNENILLPKRYELQLLFMRMFDLHHHHISGYYNSLDSVTIQVNANIGIAFVIDGMLDIDCVDLTFIPIKDAPVSHSSLIYKKNACNEKILDVFLEIVKEEL